VDRDALLEFLLRDEAFCVPFTARLRTGERGTEVFVGRDERGCVTGGLLCTSAGLLLPMLAPDTATSAELAVVMRGFRPPVHSIMGISRSVAAVEALMPIMPTTRIEYFLMTVSRENFRPALPALDGRLEVRIADVADAEALFPLQKGYELEEVVIDPRHFNDAQCLKLLRRTLREELVFLAARNGVPVAKASTNARGFMVDQIGGVYTSPGVRGGGLAKIVVSELLERIFQEKEQACLFVKKRNRPAISLYERLGFEPVTEYVISYYGV
jgi:predicted GNAT family acetyltransferase